jgi:hypothetical protein
MQRLKSPERPSRAQSVTSNPDQYQQGPTGFDPGNTENSREVRVEVRMEIQHEDGKSQRALAQLKKPVIINMKAVSILSSSIFDKLNVV